MFDGITWWQTLFIILSLTLRKLFDTIYAFGLHYELTRVCVWFFLFFFQIRTSNTVVSIETSAFSWDDGRFLIKIGSVSGLIKGKKDGRYSKRKLFSISILMKCISYDPTYLLIVMIRTQTSMLLLENDPANLNFMVFCKNIINEVISSHTRSKPYINHGTRY